MSHLILLTGGVRSGKSAQAERLLAGSPAVLYIATARCLDGEIEDAKTVAAVLKAKVQLNL